MEVTYNPGYALWLCTVVLDLTDPTDGLQRTNYVYCIARSGDDAEAMLWEHYQDQGHTVLAIYPMLATNQDLSRYSNVARMIGFSEGCHVPKHKRSPYTPTEAHAIADQAWRISRNPMGSPPNRVCRAAEDFMTVWGSLEFIDEFGRTAQRQGLQILGDIARGRVSIDQACEELHGLYGLFNQSYKDAINMVA